MKNRVLVGPLEISGYYGRLTRGLQAAGVKADFVTFSQHPFGYEGPELKSALLNAIHASHRWIRFQSKLPVLLVSSIPWLLLTYAWSLAAIFRYKTFVFGFGQSLFPGTHFDLALLKLLRKRVIMNIGHGSEARPAYVDGVHMETHSSGDAAFYVKSARKMRAQIRGLEKWCSVIIGSPFSTHFFATRPFVNWFELGIPSGHTEPKNSREVFQSAGTSGRSVALAGNRQIVIVHAPSAPLAKGTQEIRSAVEALKNEGWRINFVELIGVPHQVVMEKLSTCDFVVDQLFSDTPLPGLATEAATFGKPTILGSYAVEAFLRYVPERMRTCSYVVHPDHLKEAIEDFLLNPNKVLEIGERARSFVEEEWNNTAVAVRYRSLMNGSPPVEWLVDPLVVDYIFGACQPIHQTSAVVECIVKDFGLAGLCLESRQDLVQKMQQTGLLRS